MKTLIKLLIAAVILHAVYRAGVSAVAYYELKDAAQQLLIFGSDATPDQIHASILAKAEELALPLEPDNVIVLRDGPRTWAEATYVDPIELFPRYRYPFTYSFRVEALSMKTF